MKAINEMVRANGVTWQPCPSCHREWPWPVGIHRPGQGSIEIDYTCPVCLNGLEASHVRKVAAAISTLPDKEKALVATICRNLACPCFCGMHVSLVMEIGSKSYCRAGQDGDCFWEQCPQERDGEPDKTGRHCPIDVRPDDEW